MNKSRVEKFFFDAALKEAQSVGPMVTGVWFDEWSDAIYSKILIAESENADGDGI